MKSHFKRREELCSSNLVPLIPQNFVTLFLCYLDAYIFGETFTKVTVQKVYNDICGCFEVNPHC
jgi:hypothetical protein